MFVIFIYNDHDDMCINRCVPFDIRDIQLIVEFL